MTGTLAVVVINWNRCEETRRCLRAVASWGRLQPQVIAVDNGSICFDVDELRREFPQADFICSETNLGFGGGTNLALRRADSDHVLLLNNDATVDEADVSALVEILESDERLFAVGPVLVDDSDGHGAIAGGRDIARHIGTRWSPENLPRKGRLAEDLFTVDYLPGSVVLLRLPDVRRLGYLVESYFFGGELADLCRKARVQGRLVAVSLGARAVHDPDIAASYRQSLYPYYILRNRFLYLRRHEPRASLYLVPLWALYGVAVSLRAVTRGRLSLARILWLALSDGLRGRFGDANQRVLKVAGAARP